MDVVTRWVHSNVEEDPFQEVDELQGLIDKTTGTEQTCPATQYFHGNDNLPVCMDVDGNYWEDNFVAQLGQPSPMEQDEDGDDDGQDFDEVPVSTQHSFSEALSHRMMEILSWKLGMYWRIGCAVTSAHLLVKKQIQFLTPIDLFTLLGYN